MPINSKVKQIYDVLKSGGGDVGTEQEFNDWFFASGKQGYENRKTVYDELTTGGADAGANYGEFTSWLGLHAVKKPDQTPSTDKATAPAEANETFTPSSLAVEQPKASIPIGKKEGRLALDDMEGKAYVHDGEVQMGEEYQFKDEPYAATIARANNTIKHGTDRLRDIAKWGEEMRKPKPVEIGKSGKVVKAGTEWNPDTDKMEDVYITASGGKYNNEALAQAEQIIADDNKRYSTPEGQLEILRGERDSLEAKLDARTDEIDKKRKDAPWFERAFSGMSAMEYYENDPQYQTLSSALRKTNEGIRILEDVTKGRTNEFFHALGSEMTSGYHFNFGKADLEDLRALQYAKDHVADINRKLETGEELTSEESLALKTLRSAEWANYLHGQHDDKYGFNARAGQMAGSSIDFMIELGMMGGQPMSLAKNVAGGVTKAFTKAGSKAAATALGKKLLTNNPVQLTGKAMTKLTGATAGSLVAGAEVSNTVGMPRMVADVGLRQMGDVMRDNKGNYVFGHYEDDGNGGQKFVEGGETLLNAVIGAERAAIKENGSEVMGVFLPGGKGIVQGLKKIGLSKVSGFLTKVGGTDFYKTYSNALGKLGFNGTPSEILEEYSGSYLDYIMGGDEWKSLKDMRTHLDIVYGCITTGALLNVPRYAGLGVMTYKYNRYKHATDMADKTAEFRLTKDVWEPMKEQIDATTNENMADVINGLLDREGMTTPEAKAIVEYAKNLQAMRGWSLGMMQNNEDKDEDKEAIDHSYTIGYNVTSNEDKSVISQEVEKRRKELSEFVADEMMADFEGNPIEALNKIRSNENWSDEEKQKALDYVNAKVAYDAMTNRESDDAELVSHESQMLTDRITFKKENGGDGMVHPAKMQDGSDVHIVGGNVVMLEDGSGVDVKNSDETILVVDGSGKASFKYIKDIAGVDAPRDVEQVRQEAEANIRASIEERKAREKYSLNNEVVLHTADGDVKGTVTAEENADGQIVIETETPINGKTVQPFSREQLDEMTRADEEVVEEQPMEETPTEEQLDEMAQTDEGVVEDGTTVQQAETPADNNVNEIPETPSEETENNAEADIDSDAMPMMDVNGKQKPDYMKATPERTRRYIYEEKGLSNEEGDAFVKSQIDNVNKEIAKKENEAKKASKKIDDIDDYLEQKAARQQELDALNERKAYWESVKEEQRVASGMRYFDAVGEVSKEVKKAQQELAGDQESMEILSDLEPHTLEELASTMLTRNGKKGFKLMLKDEIIDGSLKRGVASHTGYSREDLKRMPFLFASHAKGGLPLGEFAHELLTFANEADMPYDETDAMVGVNAVLNFLGDIRRQSDINNYIQRRRIEQARNHHRLLQEQEAEWKEQQRLAKQAAERLGMSEEEWDAYLSGIEEELAAQDAYYNSEEYRNNISNNNDNDGRTNAEGASVAPGSAVQVEGQTSGTDGTVADVGRGNETTGAVKDEVGNVADNGVPSEEGADGKEEGKPLSEKIREASADVNTEPTEAQKEAGKIDWSTYDKAPASEEEWMDLMRFEYEGRELPKDKASMERFVDKALTGGRDVDETTSDYTASRSRSVELWADRLYKSEKDWFSQKNYGEAIAFFDEGEKAVYKLMASKDAQGRLKRVMLSKETYAGTPANVDKTSVREPQPIGKGVFGNIYDQFKGKAKEAIDFLRKIKGGEAIAALHHKDIGDISLVWGNKKAGLEKILKKHPEVVDNLQEMLDDMKIVEESGNRIKLESETHFAVISKEFEGEPREKWLLTAYEKKGVSDGSMDIDSEPQNGKQNGTAPLQNTSSADKGSEQSSNSQTNEIKNTKADKPIEDVGEKIGGAKKDLYKEMQRQAVENSKKSDDELLAWMKGLSAGKIFAFDLAKLRADGLSNEATTFIQFVKNFVPAKPRVEWKVRRWFGQVMTLYRLCLMSATDFEQVQSLIDDGTHNKIFEGYQAMMAIGGFDSGLHLPKDTSLVHEKEGAEMWSKANGYVSIAGKWGVYVGSQFSVYDTYEEAAEALKRLAGQNAVDKKKEIEFVVYRSTADGTCYITPKGKSEAVIADGFKTSAEAFKYIREHNAELQERYRTLMDGTKVELGENRERKGRNWRDGKDVSADTFRETFGFRGIEFGNWMKQEDRRKALNECYDALMDLADVCGVSPKALSLDGKLGMAFGSRGSGNANAHYEPGKVVINMTKTKGAGSLAHEWFHALDNYFAKMGGAETGGYATSNEGISPEGLHIFKTRSGKAYWSKTQSKYLTEAEYEAELAKHPVRKEMAEAWKHLSDAINKSAYGQRSMSYASLHSDYWKRPTEMGARAFSVWVENELSKRNATNDYLANNPALLEEALNDEQKRFSPYPFNTDAEWMDEAFGNLFATMQEKEDAETGNHVLYQRTEGGQKITEGQVAAVTERLKEAMPGTKVTSFKTQKEAEGYIAKKSGKADLFGEKDGKFAGATLPDGEVVLVEENLEADTSFHEFAHKLYEYAKSNPKAKPLLRAIEKYISEAPESIKEFVRGRYGNQSSDAFMSEVFAWALSMQSKGKLTEFLKERGVNTNSIIEVAKAQAWYANVWNKIKELWNAIKSKFSEGEYADLSVFDAYDKMSAEEIGEKLYDTLMGGKRLREAERIVSEATAKNSKSHRRTEDVRLQEESDDILFQITRRNEEKIDKLLSQNEAFDEKAKEAFKEMVKDMQPAMQLSMAKWAGNGSIRIPEDQPKVEQAVELAKKNKVDPMTFSSPMEIVERFKDTIKEKPIDPNTVPTLHKAKELPEGVVVYDVDNSEKSRKNMRQIINTHFGKDCSPWCLLQGDGEGNLTKDSKRYWEHYNAYPKQVAFRNGKLIAFSANDSEEVAWWDRMDKSHDGIPIIGKIKGDELGRSGAYDINPETGEVSKPYDLHKGNKQNGTYEEWHDNGQLKERETYKNGELDGPREKWDDNGNPVLYHRTGEESGRPGQKVNASAEKAMGEALDDLMRSAGIKVHTDWKYGQQVLDMGDGGMRTMSARHHSEKAERRGRVNATIDEANALISGKTVAEARKARRAREMAYKAETKELYEKILSGEFDAVTLQRINDYLDHVTPLNEYGRPLSKRLPSKTLRRVRKGERTSEVDVLFSRISESAVPANERTRPEGKRRIEEKKKELLKGWAIATGNWHTSVADFTSNTEPIGKGKDSVVYQSDDGKSVVKVSAGKDNLKKFRPDVDAVALFNSVFPESRYEILGYGEVDGKFVKFLKQPFVDFADSTPLSKEERVGYMANMGFEPMNDEKTAFSNGELVIADLQGNNIVKDKAGNIRVIDADVKLHTKDIGGKYEYPPVEEDFPSENPSGQIREMRVYHGTGADFDAFDHSHMGEGEGNQAYGWGTYVTELEDVGRYYATLMDDDPTRRVQALAKSNAERILKKYPTLEAFLSDPKVDSKVKHTKEEKIAYYNNVLKNAEPYHNLYEVNIPEDTGKNYLDWEGNVSAETLDRITEQLRNKIGDDAVKGKWLSHPQIGSKVAGATLKGAMVYRQLERVLGSDKAASEFLHELGYTGIKYPVGSLSGGRSDGAKNYVIFNENDLQMTDKVKFFRTPDGQAYGFTLNGEIYIDPRIAGTETRIHEYAHLWAQALRKANPKAWEQLKKELLKEQDVLNYVKRLYPDITNEDELMEEVFAHYGGRRGSERLGEEMRIELDKADGIFEKAQVITVFDKIRRALKKFWNMARDLFAGKVEGVENMSGEDFADMMMNDLTRGWNPGKFGEKDGKGRYQFVGEKGARNADHAEEVTTRLDNLEVAREMEEAKKDAKAIKMATGWERGADGKWRYEIPDIDFVVWGNADLNHRIESQPWGKEYVALTDRMFDGETLSEAEMKRFDELSEKAEEVINFYNSVDEKCLADYVRNGDLFKAYPRLRAVKVVFVNKEASVGGSYSVATNTIYVNENSLLPYEEIFAHEIQHAIQYIEGFAKGGNPDMFSDPNKQDRLFVQFDKLVRDRFGNADEGTLFGILDGATDEYRDFVSSLGEEYNGILKSLRATKKYAAKDFKDLYDRDVKQSERSSAYDQYNSLAGEVESRNVQKRLNMSAEERRASIAAETEDVAREDQIFLFGEGGESYYAQEDASHNGKVSLLDAIKTLYDKGKDYASKVFERTFFDVTDTPEFMKAKGLTGDKFTIRYGVLSRHFGKDGSHDFTESEWKQLPDAIKEPFGITKRAGRKGGYRIYTTLKTSKGEYVAIGVDVKNTGRDMEVNAISTVFGRRNEAHLPLNEEVIYRSETITPEQEALLGQPNSDQYPTIQELSATKVERNSETTSETGGKNSEEGEMFRDSEMQRDREPDAGKMHTVVEQLADKLHIGDAVQVYDNIDEIPGSEKFSERKRRSKGWYDPKTGKIVVVLGNHGSADDVIKTVLHEAVAHKGLRDLLGKDFDTFLDNVYENADFDIKMRILAKQAGLMDKGKNSNRSAQEWRRVATEEYLAELAESTDFEGMKNDGFWQKVKNLFMDLLRKAGIQFSRPLTDADLRYVLWRSYNRLENRGVFGQAEDVVMRMNLGIGEANTTGNANVVSADAVKGRLKEMQGKYKHLDGIEVVNSKQMTIENFAKLTGVDLSNEEQKADAEEVFNNGNSCGLYSPYNGKVIIFADRVLDLHELEGTIFHECYHRYSNEVSHKLTDFFWQHRGNFPKTMAALESVENYPEDSYPEELAAFRIEVMLNDARWKNADVIFQGEDKKLLDEYLDYIGYDRAEEEAPRRAEFERRAGNSGNRGRVRFDRGNQKVSAEMESRGSYGKSHGETSQEETAGGEIEDTLFRDDDDSTPRALARDTYERLMQKSTEQFAEAVQDSMRSLKNLYTSIIKAEGGKGHIEDVEGYENAYLTENRMHSSSQAQITAWEHDYINPIVEIVYKMVGKDKVKYDQLTDYMMAKHGLERNEKLARRDAQKKAAEEFKDEMRKAQKAVDKDPLDQDALDALDDVKQRMQDREEDLYFKNRGRDYAGLTALTETDNVADAEDAARQMVDDFEHDHASDIDDFWNKVNTATKSSLEKLYMSGMMDKERYEQVRDMFDYYVPLQGFDETTAEDMYAYVGSDGTRMYGTAIRTAKGRKSKADDPLSTIVMNGEAAIRQGNRNLMKQHFLNFVLNHPSDLVSVSDVWLRYNDVTDTWEQYFDADLKEDDTPAEIERKTKAFEERMKQLAESDPDHYKRSKDIPDVPYKVVEKKDMAQHQVSVRRNGKTVLMTINGNPRAAQALNGLTNPDVITNMAFGEILNMSTAVNRQLSALYTTRNPEFVVSNYMRDAIYSNCMTWVKESPNYALRFHRNFGKMNPVFLGKLFAEWESGALRERVESLPSGYPGSLDQMDYLRKRFHEFMLNGGETGWTNLRDIEQHKRDLEKAIKREGSVGGKAWEALGGCFDLMNRSVENSARFAAYLTSREMGRSLERSIYDAKEVSVNFNKKGAGDKFLNAKNQKWLGRMGSRVGGLGRSLYVFWNAGVQGMNNAVQATGRHPRKAAAVMATLFALGYAMSTLSEILCGGDDDDDNKDAYYNLPEYVRRSNVCFRWSNDMPWISIPLPIEFRAVYGLGELAAGVLMGKERYNDRELAKNIVSQMSQILPLDFMEGGGGLHAFVPSTLKPLVEAQTNKSWSGLPIYKDNKFRPHDPQWTRAYESANSQLVTATKWLNEQTGGNDIKQGWIDWNPAKLEYMLKGYLGGYFTMYDRIQKSTETAFGDREFEWRNVPVVSRLLKQGDERTEARKARNEYFDLLKEYEETGHALKGYKKIADSGREDAFEYAERLDFLHNSKAYTRYQIMDFYKPVFDAYKNLEKEADAVEKRDIKRESDALAIEFTDLIHDIDRGADIDMDKHVGELASELARADRNEIRETATKVLKKYRKNKFEAEHERK